MENDNDQYLKVERKKWNQEALINVGCRLKNIATIEDILRKEGKHQEFMSSCFKQFHDFLKNWLFSAQIVHALLLREIKIARATENELFISVGGKKTRFGQREFCLVTGLRFGELSDIINKTYVANPEGIQKRYWPGEEGEDLKLATVYDRFLKRNFLEADDSLKIALLLIAYNVLFGQPYDKKVTNWLFNLIDNLEAFNSFAWGHYVFKMTMHYLRHGFRSRNTKKGYGKVRYRLYGFPWAVEVWAMEAVESLINGFGMRLQDTMPRMRRWTMHKRPRNFVQTISDLEDNIRSGKAHVLEVLEATDDEAQTDYWVGVDCDMLEGPQFIPLVEMEMKEKNEVLGEGDEGDDGDGGDGDDGAPTEKISLKRKARKKKKKTSVKKKQRKTIPITRLNEEEDFTPGYTPTPAEDFTPGYTPTPHPLHPPQSSFRQPPPPIGGDRIAELLKAMKELPDMLENVVKREVAQLPGVLKDLMQEIGSTRGQSNEEAPLTDVRDRSLHVVKDVDATVLTEQEMAPSAEKVVTPSTEKVACGPVIQDKGKYEAFKRKLKPARRNVGTEESADKSFFLELEDPKKWLSTDLCVPCCVGEPDGHWILCKVDLLDWHISIFDPTGAKKKNIQVERFSQLMPLRRLLPSIMNRCGFFSNRSEKPRGSMFTIGVSSNQKIPQQVDKCSCGVFICKYAEMAIVKKADWNWGQKEMSDFRKEIAFEIFNNSVTYKSPIDL
ncbi:hypothetical protein Dsin_021993 [Dipteronia sinensis]|uniref:Ubiquitin-like protease family profile domain-containing protein n=1 Tax=Dipteronia sinensis TaxID=43782 RepID=A0AAE0DZB9_9ROSI|nr:hypothetical protein Dsin_021993 [Dipteronia sinensis]